MDEWKYLLAPFVVWTISQTLKVLYRLLIRREEFSWKHIVWIYMYGDGAPSTHSALCAALLTIVWKEQGAGLLFYVALTISLILVYNLLENKKKQEFLEEYFAKSNDEALRKIPRDGVLMDMSGHSFFEIGVGLVVGVILGLLIFNF